MLPYFIVVISNPENGDRGVSKISALDKEQAALFVLESHPGWQLDSVKFARGGFRLGAGRVSKKWGGNVKTKVFRLPDKFGDNAEQIINALLDIKETIKEWEELVADSAARSATGKPSERYKYVSDLCQQLRTDLSELPDF